MKTGGNEEGVAACASIRRASRRFRRSAFLAIPAGLIYVLWTLASGAAATAPFNGISGVWGGNGTVTYASGTKERLRCRVQYFQSNDDNLQQALRCASDSYNFQINAFFQHDNGVIRGRWEELVLKISGTVSGTATAGRIEGTLHGSGFSAGLTVTTVGNRQNVTIVTPDQDIRRVDIEVRRAVR